MTSLPIMIEPMQPEYNRDVSFMLAHGFQGKFNALTKLDAGSLAVFFEQLMKLFPDGPLTKRMVALQGDQVIGTLSLKWHKSHDPSAAAAAQSTHSAPYTKLPQWKELKQLGTKSTLRLLTALYFLNHEPSPGECYIADLAVHPEHQGKGTGGILLRRAQQYMQDQPLLHYLGLHVSGSNEQARRLYERLAFSVCSEEHSLVRSLLFRETKWTYMICRGLI
ncbi:GNAT family N-acetyltransferase [Paenibacillus sp. FSL R7-0331]|uniref:GNAT family N-acetyltransferase n=1 Tax=Paenibacillus sp. FSL R7-0331 TaxID=1536773 RepID=UPI0004F598F7|nr:N-acetyltransferase [Paenibacillus sp. FSL R7-0331]AIQ54138.1 hypothetical protein R70331_23180 [Paenibacillus sp. FSL R7-0331]